MNYIECPEGYLAPRDFAKRHGVETRRIYEWIAYGRVEAIKVGRHHFVKANSKVLTAKSNGGRPMLRPPPGYLSVSDFVVARDLASAGYVYMLIKQKRVEFTKHNGWFVIKADSEILDASPRSLARPTSMDIDHRKFNELFGTQGGIR